MILQNYNIIFEFFLHFCRNFKNIEKLHSLLSHSLNFFILCISKWTYLVQDPFTVSTMVFSWNGESTFLGVGSLHLVVNQWYKWLWQQWMQFSAFSVFSLFRENSSYHAAKVSRDSNATAFFLNAVVFLKKAVMFLKKTVIFFRMHFRL